MTPLSASNLYLSERKWMLLVLALLAVSVAFALSPPGMTVWAWYRSPVSPVLPVATQPPPTAPAITSAPVPEVPPPVDAQPPQTGGAATLVVGGIVLIGLIVGAVALLTWGQPPDESVS